MASDVKIGDTERDMRSIHFGYSVKNEGQYYQYTDNDLQEYRS
jgi:hypothetical protein